MRRPPAIIWFERLFFSMVVIGGLNAALVWQQAGVIVTSDPGLAGVRRYIALTAVAGAILYFVVGYFVARRASNVARWIVVVLFTINTLTLGARALRGTLEIDPSGALSLVAYALFASSLWLMFRPESGAWFSGNYPANTEIFR